MPLPLVAILGRPNVGKSTLFNRLTERRDAIVDDASGITRDRVYGTANWNGRDFAVTDTGGYVPASTETFEAAIREQAEIAIQEADILLMVVDVTSGITDLDLSIARMLLRVGKPVFVAANKADNVERRWEAAEFYKLGLSDVHPVSAINGSGTGELLDDLVRALPEQSEAAADEEISIALIGRPNVGKSSLANHLLGARRSIVTDVAGTTRDAVDAVLMFGETRIRLVDTAGLRRKARIRENVEYYSLLRTEQAIQRCDVCVLLIDAGIGIENQDIKVLHRAEQMRKGMVIAVNKWDLVDKEQFTTRDAEILLRERLKTLSHVPAVFISALTGKRAHKVLEVATQVAAERRRRIPTAELNAVVEKLVERHQPPAHRGSPVRIKYATQVRSDPPVINFFCNHPRGVKEGYRRYLENNLREHFGFEGVPLTLSFKAK